MAAEEYGAVVHLGNKTYDEFIESHVSTGASCVLLCRASKNIEKQQFEQLSSKLWNVEDF